MEYDLAVSQVLFDNCCVDNLLLEGLTNTETGQSRLVEITWWLASNGIDCRRVLRGGRPGDGLGPTVSCASLLRHDHPR